MANIIASGITQANSADIVVAAGTPTTISMSAAGADSIPASARAKCKIQIKSAGGEYTTVAELTREQPALVIDGPGTYRVQRQACRSAVLVDQD